MNNVNKEMKLVHLNFEDYFPIHFCVDFSIFVCICVSCVFVRLLAMPCFRDICSYWCGLFLPKNSQKNWGDIGEGFVTSMCLCCVRMFVRHTIAAVSLACLLYTSDAADE